MRIRLGLGVFLLALGCGDEASGAAAEDTSPGGTPGPGTPLPNATPPSAEQPTPPPVLGGGDCDSGDFELRTLGTIVFQGQSYPVVLAQSCETVLSHVRKGKTYAYEETATHYVIDAHFELPYLPGVMDQVAFTPGETNLGWANGIDVREAVAQLDGLPLLFHVSPGYEYGYFTDFNDGQGDIFGAFRPTWRFVDSGGAIAMQVFQPPDTSWPRHRGGWNPREINKEIGFGFYVDTSGKVYVPKAIPLARQAWDDELRCVVINRASNAVPVTRTQFPGDESYYMAETHLPGHASPSSHGHLYWGHKGKPMRDVAKWDETLPGNFDKPFGGGCSKEGYSIAHAEGFTWPELRAEMRDKMLAGEIAPIPAENLYRVSLYVQKGDAAPKLHGTLFYQWDGDEWLPMAEGDELIPIDPARNTFRISGYVPPGDRAFVVIEDL